MGLNILNNNITSGMQTGNHRMVNDDNGNPITQASYDLPAFWKAAIIK